MSDSSVCRRCDCVPCYADCPEEQTRGPRTSDDPPGRAGMREILANAAIESPVRITGEGPIYGEGGWIREGHIAVCPECKMVQEGTISWHLEHEAKCAWKPAGTWFAKRLAAELKLVSEADPSARVKELEEAIGVMAPTICRGFLQLATGDADRTSAHAVLKRLNDAMGQPTEPLDAFPAPRTAEAPLVMGDEVVHDVAAEHAIRGFGRVEGTMHGFVRVRWSKNRSEGWEPTTIIHKLAPRRERDQTNERKAESGRGSTAGEVRQDVPGAEGDRGDRVPGGRGREGVLSDGAQPAGVDAGTSPPVVGDPVAAGPNACVSDDVFYAAHLRRKGSGATDTDCEWCLSEVGEKCVARTGPTPSVADPENLGDFTVVDLTSAAFKTGYDYGAAAAFGVMGLAHAIDERAAWCAACEHWKLDCECPYIWPTREVIVSKVASVAPVVAAHPITFDDDPPRTTPSSSVAPYTHERGTALVRKWTERLGCTAPEDLENVLLSFGSAVAHEVNGAVVRALIEGGK